MNRTQKSHPPTCPLSGSTDTQLVFDVVDHSISGETFSVYENAVIPFRFTFPTPDETAISRFYDSDDYISHSNSTVGFIASLYQLARKYTTGMKKRIVQNASSLNTGNLLDYGCGTGEFANAMKHAGWETIGIEPSEKALDFAIGEHGLEVFTSINSISDTARFDVITAWHVLEHVHQLHQTMAECHNKLTKNGTLILAVPNFQSFDAKYYKSYWAGYDVPRHLYHFSPESMRFLANKHGFEITNTKRMWLDSFYVSILSESYLKQSLILGYARAFFIGLWSDFLALFNRENCSSLIYVLKKR